MGGVSVVIYFFGLGEGIISTCFFFFNLIFFGLGEGICREQTKSIPTCGSNDLGGLMH